MQVDVEQINKKLVKLKAIDSSKLSVVDRYRLKQTIEDIERHYGFYLVGMGNKNYEAEYEEEEL